MFLRIKPSHIPLSAALPKIEVDIRGTLWVLGRCLKPRNPDFVNPNDPWWGLVVLRDNKFTYIYGKKVKQ